MTGICSDRRFQHVKAMHVRMVGVVSGAHDVHSGSPVEASALHRFNHVASCKALHGLHTHVLISLPGLRPHAPPPPLAGTLLHTRQQHAQVVLPYAWPLKCTVTRPGICNLIALCNTAIKLTVQGMAVHIFARHVRQ